MSFYPLPIVTYICKYTPIYSHIFTKKQVITEKVMAQHGTIDDQILGFNCSAIKSTLGNLFLSNMNILALSRHSRAQIFPAFPF